MQTSTGGNPLTEATHLVEADQVDLPTDVDPLGADAEDADLLEAPLGVHDAGRHGGRQSRGHGDGDDVQRLQDDLLDGHLDKHTHTHTHTHTQRAGFFSHPGT